MDGRADRLEDLEFLTRDDLVERKIVGRSMSYAYGDTRSKYYDPDFPKAIKIKGRVKFRASEVKAWLDIVERRTGNIVNSLQELTCRKAPDSVGVFSIIIIKS